MNYRSLTGKMGLRHAPHWMVVHRPRRIALPPADTIHLVRLPSLLYVARPPSVSVCLSVCDGHCRGGFLLRKILGGGGCGAYHHPKFVSVVSSVTSSPLSYPDAVSSSAEPPPRGGGRLAT
eukprot:c14824_g1_i1 orf=3-362(-)